MTNTTLGIHPDFLNFVRPSPHSTFSPSAIDRWALGACSYSIQASVGIPEETSVYAEEGTLAHSVCEAVFREHFFLVPFPEDLSMKMVMLPDRGAEMMDCAVNYTEVIGHWLNNHDAIGEIIWYGLEKGVPVFPEEGAFGTADCLIIGTKASVVIDFKYGRGKNVQATTKQLKMYAAGIARYLINVPKDYKIFAVVYQPRTDMHPKETFYTMDDLNQMLKDIWEAIQNAKRKDLEPIEGNHCYWCPAKRTKDPALKCKAILQKPIALANENFNAFLADMNAPVESLKDANPKRDQALLKILALAPLVKQIAEDAKEEIKMRLQNGEYIDGVRLIDEEGKRQLNADTDEQAATLLKATFPELNPWKIIPETKKIRTITDIEKQLGKHKLDHLCVKKITKKVDILDDKIRAILGEMSVFGTMITNGHNAEE